MEEYILNPDDFTYRPFPRRGFSGKLYIASDKFGRMPDLLIKHEEPNSACNEYMYSRLASFLGIYAPKVYLFRQPSKDTKRFATPYVAGIEYIEGLRAFSLDEVNKNPECRREYAANYALEVMLSQIDSVQMSMTPNGHIISYDYADAFYLTSLVVAAMKRDEETRMMAIRNSMASFRRASYSSLAGVAARLLQQELKMNRLNEVYPYYHEPMRKILQITEEQAGAMTKPLYELYPLEILVFYEEYIKILQEKIRSYFLEIKENGQGLFQ